MLKKAIAIAITIPILGLGNAAIAADEDSSAEATGGKDWNVSVGLKLWRNEWTVPGVQGSGQSAEYHSGAELGMIPMLSARYKKFALSASYMPKTDYNFGVSNVVDFGWNSNWTTSKLTGERSEFDINAGYYVLPSLMVTLGYKSIERNFVTIDLQNTIYTSSANQDTSGLTIGFATVAPVSDKIGFYGSFAYGLNMQTKWATGLEYDNDYYLGEVGFLYGKKLDGIPVLESASAYVGYRFQALIEDYQPLKNNSYGEKSTSSADYTQGLVIGVNLSF